MTWLKVLSYLCLGGLIFMGVYRYKSGQSESIDQNISLRGQIAQILEIEKAGEESRISFKWQRHHLLCILPIEESRLFNIGDKGLILGELRPLPKTRFPDDFNYRNYLLGKGYTAILDLDSFLVIDNSTDAYLYFRRWRINLEERIEAWNLDRQTKGLLKALLLGSKGDISPEMRNKFASAGIAHLLAVSGLHLGIIYLLMNKLVQFIVLFPGRRIWSSLVILSGLWSYAIISGAGPSVIRAAAMFSLLIGTRLLRRRSSSLRVMVISAGVLIFLKPSFIFSIGFQLSYAALVGIIFLVPKMQTWFSPKNIWLKKLMDLIYVSTAAQVFTLPISLLTFGKFPLYFILGNLITMPLVGIIMYTGLLLMGLDFFIDISALLPFYEFLLKIPIEISSVIGDWPYSQLDIKLSKPYAIIMAAGLSSWVFLASWSNFYRYCIPILIWITVLSFLVRDKIVHRFILEVASINQLNVQVHKGPYSYSYNWPNSKSRTKSSCLGERFIDDHIRFEKIETHMFRLELDQNSVYYLVKGGISLSPKMKGTIIYCGISLEKEKSWRQWCQDYNHSFYSTRNQWVRIFN